MSCKRWQAVNKNKFSLWVLALACLLCEPCAAQERIYQIEAIVFRLTADVGDDHWSLGPITPNFETAVELAPSPASELDPIYEFTSLHSSAKALQGVYSRLHASPSYEPLVHVAWQQSASSIDSVRLRLPKDPRAMLPTADTQPRVDGTVALYVTQTLRLDVDVVLAEPLRHARIHESRGIKLKELHYFDHAAFGVLVQVTVSGAVDGASGTEVSIE